MCAGRRAGEPLHGIRVREPRRLVVSMATGSREAKWAGRDVVQCARARARALFRHRAAAGADRSATAVTGGRPADAARARTHTRTERPYGALGTYTDAKLHLLTLAGPTSFRAPLRNVRVRPGRGRRRGTTLSVGRFLTTAVVRRDQPCPNEQYTHRHTTHTRLHINTHTHAHTRSRAPANAEHTIF